jgi:ribonucleoside-diphosphate reductase beta chain
LVNLIKSENPDWWTPQLIEDLIDATIEAFEAESEIVDWIFEKGDLDFLTKVRQWSLLNTDLTYH